MNVNGQAPQVQLIFEGMTIEISGKGQEVYVSDGCSPLEPVDVWRRLVCAHKDAGRVVLPAKASADLVPLQVEADSKNQRD